jgi:XTP/dITP diphosphohydrolase
VNNRLLIATTNPGKLREIRPLLASLPVELVTLDRWPELAAPEETGVTFEENARLKARYYAAATGITTVAEDSGLEIDVLGGAPGVESARFGGVDTPYPEKFARLYERLRAFEPSRWTARFVCALALVEGQRVVFETRGTVEGVIAQEPRGSGGFGYDPIFEPFSEPPGGRTVGQMSAAEKHALSHRGKAARAMAEYLRAEGW